MNTAADISSAISSASQGHPYRLTRVTPFGRTPSYAIAKIARVCWSDEMYVISGQKTM